LSKIGSLAPKLASLFPTLGGLKAVPLSVWLVLLSVIGPAVTYGAMKVQSKVAIAAAVKIARAEEISTCRVKIGGVVSAVNQEAMKRIAAAKAAGSAVTATPEDAKALKALCDKSASCRERGRK
jgi:hypothetical protein